MPETRQQIEIYTDGGCSPNPGPGGWAAILIHPQRTLELSGGETDTTNNRMELTAAVKALQSLNQPCVIDFYTDSEYLRRGITEWLDGWIANNWRRGKSPDAPPVANADLWRALVDAIQRHTINWHWVKGHAGNPYNERADELASAAIPHPDKPAPSADVTQIVLAIAGSTPHGPHGWAASIKRDGVKEVISGNSPDDTPNHFSLVAAIELLEHLPPDEPVHFWTNNSYLYDGITTWVNGWRRQGWAKPDRFREEWQTLDQLNRQRRVKWIRFKRDSLPEGFGDLKKAAEEAREQAIA
ncbi:MAG: hypothetical protein Kow0077_16020 [Anaerolineae bacterium]